VGGWVGGWGVVVMCVDVSDACVCCVNRKASADVCFAQGTVDGEIADALRRFSRVSGSGSFRQRGPQTPL
jgi:hypothetical protein